MKKSKLLVISALALGGVLASCGGSKPASSSQAPASNDSTTSAPATSEETVEKVVALKDGFKDLSKQELGTDYGMAQAAKTDEVYVQIENYTSGVVGKKVSELKADTAIAGVTIQTGDYVKAINSAFNKKKAVTLTTDADADVKFGIGMTAMFDAKKGELSTYVGGATVVGNKVAASDFDCITGTFEVSDDAVAIKANKYKADKDSGEALVSKVDLGKDYGMGADKLGYVHNVDALITYVNGKTVDEIAGYKYEQGNIEGVTIVADGLTNAAKEAVAYSQKDVITSKPQADKDVKANTFKLTAGSTFTGSYGIGYSTLYEASKGKLTVTTFAGLFDAEGTIKGGRLDVQQISLVAADAQ